MTSILLRCNVLVEDHGPGNATMRVRGGPPAAGPFDRAYAPTPSLAPHMGSGGHGSNGGGGGAINGSHHGGGGSLSVSTYVCPTLVSSPTPLVLYTHRRCRRFCCPRHGGPPDMRTPRPHSTMITAAKAGISSVFGGSPSKKLPPQAHHPQPQPGPAATQHPGPHRPDPRHGSHQSALAQSVNAENQLILAFKVLASHDFFPKQMFPKGSREKALPSTGRDKATWMAMDGDEDQVGTYLSPYLSPYLKTPR